MGCPEIRQLWLSVEEDSFVAVALPKAKSLHKEPSQDFPNLKALSDEDNRGGVYS